MHARRYMSRFFLAAMLLLLSGAMENASVCAGVYGGKRGRRSRTPDPRTTWRPAKVYTRAPGARPRTASTTAASMVAGSVTHPAVLRREREAAVAAEAASPPAPPPAAAAESPFGVLKRMSGYLGAIKRFSFNATDTVDKLLDSGQKVQMTTNRRVRVARPDKVQVEASGDIGSRKGYYNGKTLTLFDPKGKEYGVVEVPGEIDTLLDFLDREYGLTLPVIDIIHSDLYNAIDSPTIQGSYLGRHKVGDAECHHLAFQGDRADWQIWVEAGERPLPRKLVITYKKMPHSPEYEATIGNWNLDPNLPPALFEFTPPAGVEKRDTLPIAREKST